MIAIKASEEKENVFDGFKLGLEPLKIIDMRKSHYTQKMFFAITWLDHEDIECIDAETAKLKCPELVCEYYESIINGKDNGCTYAWKINLDIKYLTESDDLFE